MVIAVNFLTAVLTFVSMFGYGVIYTVFLKPTTPQNIVIGGTAGAAPPLLGWCAYDQFSYRAELFVISHHIYLTPPHFWSLALARKEEYQAAGTPMLPVTHGEQFTLLQIVFYTFYWLR